MSKVSDEQLADAGLNRATLRRIQSEINGSEREALAHWLVVSDRVRQYYREATP
jgi:hypothetical protein